MPILDKARRIRGLPPKFVAEEVARRIKKHINHGIRKTLRPLYPAMQSDRALLKKTRSATLESLVSDVGSFSWFFTGRKNKKEILSALKKYPREKAKTLEAAKNILGHNFDILGSGDTPLGKEIPWNTDFVSGKTWENKYYTDIKTVRFDGSDIKIPWELSRCQHFVTLGKAYWYTNDEKYAKEFVAEFLDWNRKNPPDFSPNWAVSMEVAIRAVNWIWAYFFFNESKEFTQNAKKEMAKSLYFHAKHIYENIEYNGQYSGNHYFSNGIGLLYLGLFLSPFKESEKWKSRGIEIILGSMQSQILPDGVDFEKSTAYHRLVTDFAVHAYVLCKKNRIALPSWFGEKLSRMIEFIAYYTKPDGCAPLIGDSDDGRLVILEDMKNINDHRHHLSTGAVIFKNGLFKSQAGKFHEESLWLLGKEGEMQFEKIKPVQPKSNAFQDGGFFIMRDKKNYLFADCGGIGLEGLGGHGHNDTLSFELFAGDKTFITDSGTYTYSRDYRARAQFRKTSAHSTIGIDGQEIAPFGERDLWTIKDITNAKHTLWRSDIKKDVLAGEHEGYKRLGNIIIRRKIVFEKRKQVWVIEDEIRGDGEHEAALYFHLAPLPVRLESGGLRTLAKGTNIRIEISGLQGMEIELIKGFVSYSYGTREESKTLKVIKKGMLPMRVTTRITVLK